MTTTQTKAHNDMCKHVSDAVQASALVVLGANMRIEWPDVTLSDVPSSTDYLARVSIQTVARPQTTFSPCVARAGNRRFTAKGILIVLFLGPRTDQMSGAKIRKLGQDLKVAHVRSQIDSVWLRNIVGVELQPDAGFNRFRVVAEFNYDEIM